jgi:hypothetical protein
VTSVPARRAHAHPDGPLVVRATSLDDVAACAALDPARVVWIEAPLRLADAPFPVGAPLDIVLADPAVEAPGLYSLTRIRTDHPVRVTIVGRPGMARAARLAMALQFPVRLLVQQPSAAVLAELDQVTDRYLHDSRTSAPVEFFQAALAWWLRGDAPPPWVALEVDPAWFPRVDGAGAEHDPTWPPREADFVAKWFAGLVSEGAECATCPARDWCQGYFKWPDRSYGCDGVVRLLARLEASAAQLARDLDEARALEP